MGFSNKIATRVHTRDRELYAQLPGNWDADAMPLVAAIVRRAAGAIAQQDLQSSGVRGSDFLGIRSAKYEQASVVWVEQRGAREWTVTLGQATTAGQAIDWQLDIAIAPQGISYIARLTTPAVLTRDGTLVHKKAYKEVSDLIATDLESGTKPTTRIESDLSQKGLGLPGPRPIAQRKVGSHWQTVIRTSLPRDELDARLKLVPYAPAPGPSTTSYRWRLGPTSEPAGQTADLTIADEGDQRVLTLNCQLEPSGHTVNDLLTAERAYALPVALLRAIRLFDANATREDTELPTQPQSAGDSGATQ